MNKIEQANKFLQFIKGQDHLEFSVGTPQNKLYDVTITENMLTDNLWVGVVSRKQIIDGGKGSGKSDCCNLKWLWMDIDTKDSTELVLERFKGIPEPSLIINSGHGYHCYWRLTQPIQIPDINRVESLMGRMCEKIGGDSARKNINSIMRVPGSTNHKREKGLPPVEVFKIKRDKPAFSYTLEQLEAVFPETKREFKKQSVLSQIQNVGEGTRNSTLFKETLQLLEKGWKVNQVYNDLDTKYEEKGMPKSEFENTFKSAVAKFDIQNLKDEKMIRANKIKSDVMKSLNEGNVQTAINRLSDINEEKKEIVFETFNITDEVDQSVAETYKIGHPTFDSFSPFEKSSVCLIAGLTGSGKTVASLNFAKAFIENNKCDVLFLEAESETNSRDLKINCKKMSIPQLNYSFFPRFEDMKKGFMEILDKYKGAKGKYPEIIFVDTFEKMNKSTENFNLKLNTEALSVICQLTGCLIISISQLSSSQFKITKKGQKYLPMTIQQGGMDVINNCNTWISMVKDNENLDTGFVHYNNFYFGKIRNSNASVNLLDKYIHVPFNMQSFVLSFKNLEIKEDTI